VAVAAGMRSGRGVVVEELRAAIDEAALAEPTADVDGGELEQELSELNEASPGAAPIGEG
jgi:hypothetical protein